jgi:beta-N-acetylhexosaminidase
MGPLMMDCRTTYLDDEEKEMLSHPLTGGVILFRRNFDNVAQLSQLVSAIRKAAKHPLIIAVDHEGGRVQRFREGFTALPAMGEIEQLAVGERAQCELAMASGVIMAYELKRLDIDLSFAPVLDINGVSNVIGDRGFSTQVNQVTLLSRAFIDGMDRVGMPATGKHFPGHGSVVADSHVAAPIDTRPLSDIIKNDLPPFSQLIQERRLAAIMPAHVTYSQVDPSPAGFSSYWLQKVLRQQLGFDGVIFSDDLSMEGAGVAGDYCDRAIAALDAGCDMVLACNNPLGAQDILDGLPTRINNKKSARIQTLSGHRILSTAAKEYARACVIWQQYAN